MDTLHAMHKAENAFCAPFLIIVIFVCIPPCIIIYTCVLYYHSSRGVGARCTYCICAFLSFFFSVLFLPETHCYTTLTCLLFYYLRAPECQNTPGTRATAVYVILWTVALGCCYDQISSTKSNYRYFL